MTEHQDEAVPVALQVEVPNPKSLLPVAEQERVHAVDTLRGFALLGILMMNITAFGQPGEAYVNPMSPGLAEYAGEFTGFNKAVWFAIHLLFDMKMMTIFSML